MAAATAMPGNLMMDPVCTPTIRLQRAGVYVPPQGPKHPISWLGGRDSSGLAGRSNSWLASHSNSWLTCNCNSWNARFVPGQFQGTSQWHGTTKLCTRLATKRATMRRARTGKRLPRGEDRSAPDAGEGAGPGGSDQPQKGHVLTGGERMSKEITMASTRRRSRGRITITSHVAFSHSGLSNTTWTAR